MPENTAAVARAPLKGLGALLLGAVAGAALQLQQPRLWPAEGYGALASGAAALAMLAGLGWLRVRARRQSRAQPHTAGAVARWLAVFVLAAAASFAGVGWRATVFSQAALDPAVEGRDVEVTGIVAAMPQRSELGLRFRFDVEDSAARVPPRVLLGWYDAQPPDLRAGDRWRFTVRLKAPHGNLNPHGFDYELWLWDQGLQATGSVRAGPRDPRAERLAATGSHPIERARHAVRDAIFSRVQDPRVAGVLAALVTGDQAAIERADWDVFRATGVAHLMSISGLHITMFAWAAALAVAACWRRSVRACLAWPAQHAALVGGTALAALYAAFSGWGVPAQRTIWMLATVALLRLSGRRWPSAMVWLLACAVVVTLDPWALMQAGFWLSFVAVGVLFASDRRAQEAVASRGWRARAIGMLREQWVVTVALSPLALLLFGQVSVVGLAANLVAIPWVTVVVTPLAMGGAALAPLWDAATVAVQALTFVLQGFASVPYATVSVPAAPLWAGAAGVVGGALLVMRLPWAVRFAGVPLMLPLVLWTAVRPPDGEFELLAADVGQGNALVVRTARHTLVYDAGPRYGTESDAGHRVVVPLLRALGETVDTLVLSHRDSDHTGGAAAVLAMQPTAALLSSIEATHELQSLRPARRCVAGQRWRWDGVDFSVLHPREEDYRAGAKPNSISCVLRIATTTRAALLAGDIEKGEEARLADVRQRSAEELAGGGGARGASGKADIGAAVPAIAPEPAEPRAGALPLAADVLLVPHHGSKTSSTDAWLDAVHPSVAIVQAGYRNRFGHPAPPVLARYEARGIRVVETAKCGAATWRTDRPEVISCERERGMRYWHHAVPH